MTTWKHAERWQEITKQIFETFLWPNMQSFNHRASQKYTYKYEGQFGTGNKRVSDKTKSKLAPRRFYQKKNELISLFCREKQKGKQNKFVRSFFGRIYGTPICLRFYLTFRMPWSDLKSFFGREEDFIQELVGCQYNRSSSELDL